MFYIFIIFLFIITLKNHLWKVIKSVIIIIIIIIIIIKETVISREFRKIKEVVAWMHN